MQNGRLYKLIVAVEFDPTLIQISSAKISGSFATGYYVLTNSIPTELVETLEEQGIVNPILILQPELQVF